jgi:hypothetical protein
MVLEGDLARLGRARVIRDAKYGVGGPLVEKNLLLDEANTALAKVDMQKARVLTVVARYLNRVARQCAPLGACLQRRCRFGASTASADGTRRVVRVSLETARQRRHAGIEAKCFETLAYSPLQIERRHERRACGELTRARAECHTRHAPRFG